MQNTDPGLTGRTDTCRRRAPGYRSRAVTARLARRSPVGAPRGDGRDAECPTCSRRFLQPPLWGLDPDREDLLRVPLYTPERLRGVGASRLPRCTYNQSLSVASLACSRRQGMCRHMTENSLMASGLHAPASEPARKTGVSGSDAHVSEHAHGVWSGSDGGHKDPHPGDGTWIVCTVCACGR